jgi:vitamin B12 transporter
VSPRLTVSATWFQQQFQDLIQYTFQLDPQEPNYFNVAAASARGLELQATAEVASGIRADASTTLLRTRVEDAGFDSGEGATFVEGQRLLRRPGVSGTLAIHAARSPRVTLDLSATYVGERDDRDFSTFPATPVTLDGYVRVDAAAAFHLRAASGSGVATTLLLRADNLFDARYEAVFGFPAARRMWTVGLRIERGGTRPSDSAR